MSPSEIVAYGFDTSPVVMMNEAPSGWLRCARTRRTGREILPAAHAAGCRDLAMEALPNAWRQIDEAPMMVWCGNAHHAKRAAMEWTPMGVRFTELAGFEPFSIDQSATISLAQGDRPNIALTDNLRHTLDGFGGTAGFVAADPPPGLEVPDHFNALILSTDNDMS